MKKRLQNFLAILLVLCMIFGMGISNVSAVADETYDTFDEITLSDLKIDAGYFSNTISAGEKGYTATSTSNSVVVKFQWQVSNDLTDKGWILLLDGNGKYDRSVWFRSDMLIFGFNSSHRKDITPGYTTGTHDVEFGRKLVTSGDKKDKYYFYLAIDGETIASTYTTFSDATNKIAFEGGQLSSQRFADYGAEPEAPETYDEFDEITLSDLGIDTGYFSSSVPAGAKEYTANSTSNSVVLKFQWQVSDDLGTSGWLVSLDNNYDFKRGVCFRSDMIIFGFDTEFDTKIRPGYTTGTHDVEFGRKLVTSGENKGKYYFYVAVDGAIIASTYTAFENMTNKIGFDGKELSSQRFADCGAEPETFDSFDEITLSDLGLTAGNFAYQIGNGAKSYYATSASNSVVLKFQWQVSEDFSNSGWLVSLDKNYDSSRGVCFRKDKIYFGHGSDFAKQLSPITTGTHDIEFGRKLVITGKNKDKYYIYLSVDGTVLTGAYTTFSDMKNEIGFDGKDLPSQRFADAKSDEELDPEALYYPYDVINYTDLMDESGKALGSETSFNGAKVFTYNRTSNTGSAIIKYRWQVGTVPKFQLSFDKVNANTMECMFGVQVEEPSKQYPNGDLWLRLTYGPHINLPITFEVDNIYDIEFARLKVAQGTNKDKYYVYIKIDGELIAESYVSAGVVRSNNHYSTAPNSADVAISNEIFMSFFGTYGNVISETWENGKGYYVDFYANGNLVEKVPFTFDDPTIEEKEPAVPEIPYATGVWEPHKTSGLTKGFSVDAVYTVKVPTSAGTDISLNKFNGANVDLNTNIVNEYLATPMAQQSDYVRNYHSKTSGYQDYQNITFRWSDIGNNSSYTVYFADNIFFNNAFIVTATGKELVNKVGIFIPGKTYYWFVVGNDTGIRSAIDSFTAQDKAVRYITAGAVTNMRDLGGYITTDGKKVNYGLVYRGASLDEDHSFVDSMARHVFNFLGMKSEIELRGGLAHSKTGWDNGNYNVYNIVATGYSPILEIDDGVKAEYKATFEAMADINNYPFYFHCSAGADRTGTFAYLLNGLLGVPYETLREDFELTTFSEVGRRVADGNGDDDSFDKMHTSLMEQYGDGTDNVSVAIENFLTQYVGVDKATIDSIRAIMLEKNPADLDGNGIVNSADLLLLKKVILNNITEIEYDVNADGNVDILDLVSMKKVLAG